VVFRDNSPLPHHNLPLSPFRTPVITTEFSNHQTLTIFLKQTQIIGATSSNNNQVASSDSTARMGNDQSNWSAPCGRTCIWGQQHRKDNPPPDIINDQRHNIRQSQSCKQTEETQVFSPSTLPTAVSQIKIGVICRQELGNHKVQDQQQSCQLWYSGFNAKC
jgi:hypothetical protein